MHNTSSFDVLVIGSGAAGLGLSLSLANKCRVAVICKEDLATSSSQYAQGGIAAVMNQAQDSFESHISDTLNAGAGLCDPPVVDYTVRQAKPAIEWLIKQGVQFTIASQKPNHYHLTQEGGHSKRRILHSADKTGEAVVTTLSQQVIDHPNITSLIKNTAIDLIVHANQCYGAHFLDNRTANTHTILAKCTVLATGGASMVYLNTSNGSNTTGDGIAMSLRAGARIANMEFNQFHPTCFYNPNGKTFLVTEAMRGEGAKLLLPSGERFMDQYDSRAELAPRDIVSRAIQLELKKNTISHVYLDISHEKKDKIKRLFPTIFKLCMTEGLDITKKAIPVVPAAHYTCGGVVTNLDGKTDINCLYAVGETACTGLHGANRMASNSLLECLVFARSAAMAICQQLDNQCWQVPEIAQLPSHSVPANPTQIKEMMNHLRRITWNYAGVTRSNSGLQLAQNELSSLKNHIQKLTKNTKPTKALLELKNLSQVAELIITSAKMRTESRGVHFNSDIPESSNIANNSFVRLDNNNLTISYATNIHPLIT